MSEREEEMDEELREHIARLTERNVAAGMSPADARRAALIRFGSPDAIAEAAHAQRRGAWLADLVRDARFGVRMLRRSPAFTLLALLALALGIGANTALFSVVDALVLRPLPFAAPAELVSVRFGITRQAPGQIAIPELLDLRAQSRSFSGLAGFNQVRFVDTGGTEPAVLNGMAATANFFSVLGVQPTLGRGFYPDEDEPGRARVAVLSYELWQRRFGGDPSVLGRTLVFDGERFTAVGVAPRGFRIPIGAVPGVRGMPGFVDLWVPLNGAMDVDGRRWRLMRYLGVIARLAAGADRARSQTELDAIGARLAQQHPQEHEQGRALHAIPLAEDWLMGGRRALLVLLGAVGFLLLMACANVASLQLARATARRQELAVRAALGARRGRLVRQLLAEGLVVALLGGALGILLARLSLDALVRLIPSEVPRFHGIGLDLRVLAYTLAVALGSGLLVGLLPALASARPDLQDALKGGGHGTGPAPGRAASALVVAQVALALVLLVGAGLLTRSFARVIGADPGFDARAMVTGRINVPEARYPKGSDRRALRRELQARLQALPGARGSTVAGGLPFAHWGGAHKPTPPGGEPFLADANNVAPGYFQTMGIALVRGRGFQEADEEPGAPLVGVVNETFVRRYWPEGGDPVGRRVRFGHWPGEIALVGVVTDTRRLDHPPRPELYMPLGGGRQLFVAVRAEAPAALAGSLRAAVKALDPQLPLTEVRTMEEAIGESLAQRRLATSLLGLFAALALALTAIGVFGVVSHAVARRTREVAVRMALGARTAQVLGAVMREGLALAAIGTALGLAGALALTRLLAGMLYEVSPTDPTTFAATAALVMLLALLANYLPARRAAALAPMEALRHE
jgi:predicted permease